MVRWLKSSVLKVSQLKKNISATKYIKVVVRATIISDITNSRKRRGKMKSLWAPRL